MPALTIDGARVSVPEGATILEAARSVGIEIPTLCHHEALEPWGGCRLCIVDVTRTDWNGWQKMVIGCMAAAEEGLIVTTTSDRVKATRRVCLDLLLARCPDTPLIRELAAAHGISATSYRRNPEPTDCILCGLCTRVCEAHATSAITSTGRGTERAIGTFAEQPPVDCIGCGACADVCPTGFIEDRRSATGYEIWGRSFPTAACLVDESHCIACGACEEACPFSVPRVALRAGGQQVAVIARQHCRGCGACVGACPTGAIDQERASWPGFTCGGQR